MLGGEERTTVIMEEQSLCFFGWVVPSSGFYSSLHSRTVIISSNSWQCKMNDSAVVCAWEFGKPEKGVKNFVAVGRHPEINRKKQIRRKYDCFQ